MSIESTSMANLTRSRFLPRARSLAGFAACLMLILPMPALADEIVYFTNGKAMTVKKIEKGDRFTILEIEGGGRIGVPNDRIARIETLVISRPSAGASASPRIAGTPLQAGQQNRQNRRAVATTPAPSVSPAGVVGGGAVAGRNAGVIQHSSDSARAMARRNPSRATGQNMRGAGPGGRLTAQGAGRFGSGEARGRTGRPGGRNIRGGRPNARGTQRLNNPRNLPAAAAGQATGQNTPTNENDASPSDETTSEEN